MKTGYCLQEEVETTMCRVSGASSGKKQSRAPERVTRLFYFGVQRRYVRDLP
jgi:hypothetical protein